MGPMVFLRRGFIRVSFPFVKLSWFLFRPKTAGAVCLIEHEGKFLFVKQAYIKNAAWTIPGGGVHKGESPETAVRREVLEEVGIVLGQVQKLGDFVSIKEYKEDTVHCFYSVVSNTSFTLDLVEIGEGRWMNINEIPKELRMSAQKTLEFYKNWVK